MSKFEVNDASAAGTAGAIAAAAHTNLLSEFVDSGKNPVTGDKAATPSSSSPENAASGIGKALLQGAGDAVKAAEKSPAEGSAIGNLVKEAMKNGIESGASPRSDMHKNEQMGKINDGINDLKYYDRRFFGPVTDRDRTDAKEALGKGISDLVPDADKAILKQMQGALIDGNLDKFKESLGKLADDPVKMEKFLKEVNGQLKREGASVELSTDSKGNVLVYDRNGNTAVSVNAKTGETTLRAVERQNDGSIVLKPGEIINRKPAEVMKALGDEATRDITQPPFNHKRIIDEMLFKGSLLNDLKNSAPHHGGGGDKGSSIQDAIKNGLQNLVPEVKKKEK